MVIHNEFSNELLKHYNNVFKNIKILKKKELLVIIHNLNTIFKNIIYHNFLFQEKKMN